MRITSYILFFVSLFLGFTSCQDDILVEELKPLVEKPATGYEKSNNDEWLLFHRGGHNTYIYATKYSPTISGPNPDFQDAYRFPSIMRTSSTPEALIHEGSVYVFYKSGTNTDIWFTKTSVSDAVSGVNWQSPVKAIANSGIVASPKVVDFHGHLFMFYTNSDDKIYYHLSFDSGNSWSSRREISSYTNHSTNVTSSNGLNDLRLYKIAAEVKNNRLYVFFSSTSREIFYLTTTSSNASGSNWTSYEDNSPTSIGGDQARGGLDITSLDDGPGGDFVLSFPDFSGARVSTKRAFITNTGNGELGFGNKIWVNNKLGSYPIGIANNGSNRVIIGSKIGTSSSWNRIEGSFTNFLPSGNQASESYFIIPTSDMDGTTANSGTDIIYVGN